MKVTKKGGITTTDYGDGFKIIECEGFSDIPRIKYCPRCDKDLSWGEFSRNAGRYDGMRSYCRKCSREYNLKWLESCGLTEASYSKMLREENRRESTFFQEAVKDKFKWCPKCGEAKRYKEFPKDAGKRRGYGSWCKDCKNEDSKQYRLRKAALKEASLNVGKI
jgi:hypothetical protein